MDQLGKGSRIELRAIPSSPVQAVGRFSGLRPDLSGAFFVHVDGTALSRFQFKTVFEIFIFSAWLSGDDYSYSFQIGVATEAVRWGLDDQVVQRIKQWESVLCSPSFIVSSVDCG